MRKIAQWELMKDAGLSSWGRITKTSETQTGHVQQPSETIGRDNYMLRKSILSLSVALPSFKYATMWTHAHWAG